jgi:hypothetical protein
MPSANYSNPDDGQDDPHQAHLEAVLGTTRGQPAPTSALQREKRPLMKNPANKTSGRYVALTTSPPFEPLDWDVGLDWGIVPV